MLNKIAAMTGYGEETEADRKPSRAPSIDDFGSNLARQSDLQASGKGSKKALDPDLESESHNFADAYTELRYRCEHYEEPADLFGLLINLAPQHILDIDKRHHGPLMDWIGDDWEQYDLLVAQARRMMKGGKNDEQELEYNVKVQEDAGVTYARSKAKEAVEPSILAAFQQAMEFGLLDGAGEDETINKSVDVDFYQQQDIALGGALPEAARVKDGAVLTTLAWLDKADLELEPTAGGGYEASGKARLTFQVLLPDGRVVDVPATWYAEGSASTSWWAGGSLSMDEKSWSS
jgi:hypothetical protein